MSTYDEIIATFQQFGLGDLVPALEEQWKSGYTDATTILVNLKSTDAYKVRFKANDARVRAGLPELSPGEYVQMESSYRDLMGYAGLSKFFGPDDFTKWIENDVSPMEAQQRLVTAKKAVETIDSATKQALTDMYGVDSDGIAAYFLSPEKATGVLEQQYNAAVVSGTASNFNVNVNKSTAEQIGANGVGLQQAQQQFGQVADQSTDAARLGALYSDAITQDDLVKEQFGLQGGTDTTAKKKKLASQERAAFSGSSGIGQTSLSKNKQQQA